MGGFDDLAAQFDPVNNKRKGDQFELVCKWFLENDPTYKPLLRRVWLWNDWPGRKGIEAGIDLVAEDHDGKLWAIQAKAYDAAYSISKNAVDKFVAESSRPAFSRRLLIGTTDKRHHLAIRLMDDLGIPFLGLTRLREADDYLDWPATPGALRPSKPAKPKKPWDYQQAAIKDVVKGFTTADRGQLIMACGTGKTLTAWFITEKLAADRTLVLVPSLSLLKQTMREWQTANPTKPFATLPVCSDETVGSLGEDAAVAHTSDLGVPVTTDPQVIAEFLRKRSGPRVVFSTYQSSPQIAKAFTLGRVPGFDLVIADEAHRVAGPVGSDFGTVLDAAAIKAKRRLFMTATPRYFTGRVLREAKEADYEIASMDDHEKFGEVFHRLTFSKAIEDDLLTDYQVAIIGVDDATYRDWAERGTLVTLDGKKNTDARSLAGQIGLAKAMKKFDLRRVISFHSRVKAAKGFAASMPAVLDWMPPPQRPKGTLWSEHASGEMSAGERGVLLQHLKRLDDGERGLLANARCLSEGVDVPALDGVAFIDPRRSEVDIVQAVGRAIRKSDNKTVGTIVIPVFIDTDEDAEVALDSSVFKPVWDVIKALRAHDTELGEQLDELRREMGRKARGPKLPSKIYVEVPATVGREFSAAFEARLVEKVTATWEHGFGLLESYVDANGDALVPHNYSITGFNLGGWVITQRQFYMSGRLSTERAQRLMALPRWSWNAKTDRWESSFQELLNYVAENGSSLVPSSYRTKDGFQLGSWVTGQRVHYAGGLLEDNRAARLEQLPEWTWDARNSQWESAFRQLLDYVEKNGNARVPGEYRTDGFKLGLWVATQRDFHGSGRLRGDRTQRLAELPGWSWTGLREDDWEFAFTCLQSFTEKHGHSLVPSKHVSDGFPLGRWVGRQRTFRRNGWLSPDRVRRLSELTGWVWDTRRTWADHFAELVNYVRDNGDALVPHNYRIPDGFRLGLWIREQRRDYEGGTLTVERQRLLSDLPGWAWDGQEEKWEQGYRSLVSFVEREGHALVPRPYKDDDGYRLGSWVNAQRRSFSGGTLSVKRQQDLERVRGWLWDAREVQWDEGYRHLTDYVATAGDSQVPSELVYNGFRLGNWVTTRRQEYKRGKLSPERQERLQNLPGWIWEPRDKRWDEGFAHLEEFVRHSGHSQPMNTYLSRDGFRLGAWVAVQRRAQATGKLIEQRQRRLEALPQWAWRVKPERG